jgi:hypothetical protein
VDLKMVKQVMLWNEDCKGEKFLRRGDLTPHLRLMIAFTALMSGTWGTITRLSRQYAISRMFVYMLRSDLETATFQIFGRSASEQVAVEKRISYMHILSFRLEGKCSIEAISTIMKRLGIVNSSVGYISQTLDYIGSLLPNTLHGGDTIQLVIYASDEIFSHTRPILLTVEPVSSAILRIELSDTRQAEVWKKHWTCLMNNGYYSIYLVKDQGTAMQCAKEEVLSNVIDQPDTYHAVSHQLGLWVGRLEAAAYKALSKMYDRYEKLDSAVSDEVIDKRIEAYQKAEKGANEAIELYDEFHEYYLFLIHELRLFDSEGHLRNRAEAEANIMFALELMLTLEHSQISKIVKNIMALLPRLLAYFDRATEIVAHLQTIGISDEVLSGLCLAWQYQKSVIKAKQSTRRNQYKNKEKEQLATLQEKLAEDFLSMKEFVYAQLDMIVQSSALVETINSILRTYLNTTRNHITQNFLNLIMFYHNHRRYSAGKRKGKTPLEILTGKTQHKDWMELLFEEIEKVDSYFLAA